MKNRKSILFLICVLLLFGGTACRNKAKEYVKSGQEKFYKGNLDAALADFTKAIELRPNDSEAYCFRAATRQMKDDFDGALRDYNRCLEIEPNASSIIYNRGTVEALKGDLDSAQTDLTRAIALKPDLSHAYYERGKVRYKQKDLDGALSDYTKAIELKAEVAISYGNRGNVKGAKGDAEGAMADYSKSIELDPTNTFFYHLRGFLYYDTHDFTNALADLRKPASLDTSARDYTLFYIWLARARLGEESAAMEELEDYRQNRKGGQTDDWPGSVLGYLAGQLSESELFKAAESEDVNKSSEQQCEAYFYAGSKRLVDGDKMTAANYFQKCVATDHTGFSEYQSAVAELKFLKATK